MIKIQTTDFKGNGVFAERSFKVGETVLIGKIEKELSKNNSHASQIGLNRFVLHNEEMRMVNHSCNPNCGIRINSSDAHDLVAKKAIIKGEEITYDYAMRNYTIDYFLSNCKCGSDECRGKITGWKDLPNHKKMEYRNWVAPYLLGL